MSGCVTVVLTEPSLADLAPWLRNTGFEVANFTDPIAAWDTLTGRRRIAALITAVEFGPNLPHGVALARAARARIPGVRVLFIGPPETEALTDGVGMFLGLPVAIQTVSAALTRLLGAPHDI